MCNNAIPTSVGPMVCKIYKITIHLPLKPQMVLKYLLHQFLKLKIAKPQKNSLEKTSVISNLSHYKGTRGNLQIHNGISINPIKRGRT